MAANENGYDPSYGTADWWSGQDEASGGGAAGAAAKAPFWALPRPGPWLGIPYMQNTTTGQPLSQYANLVDQLYASQQPVPIGAQFARWNFGGPGWQQGGGLLGSGADRGSGLLGGQLPASMPPGTPNQAGSPPGTPNQAGSPPAPDYGYATRTDNYLGGGNTAPTGWGDVGGSAGARGGVAPGSLAGLPVIANARQVNGVWTTNAPSEGRGAASQHPGPLIGVTQDGSPVYGMANQKRSPWG